jgi:hypothetical protein
MNPTAQAPIHPQLISLERRLRQAERSFLIYKICLATLSAFVLLLIWTNRFGVVQAQSDKLRLRELDILDEKGRERIVIAAPVLIPSGGGNPKLEMTDQAGKSTAVMPSQR